MENLANTTVPNNEHSQYEPRKASVAHRFAAHLIDHFIISIVLIVPFMVVLFRGGMDSPYDGMFFYIIMLIFTAFFVYGAKDVIKGQSFGKFVLGIAVRDSADPNNTPSAAKLFLRNIFTVIWPVEFLVLVCSPDRTKLGDKIAGTSVYHTSQKPKTFAMIAIGAVLIITVFVGALVIGISTMLRNHPTYQMAINYIKANPQVLAIVGEVESFGFMPSGSISYTGGGRGTAEYTIRVRGRDENIRVHIQLAREPLGDWEIVGFRYRR